MLKNEGRKVYFYDPQGYLFNVVGMRGFEPPTP